MMSRLVKQFKKNITIRELALDLTSNYQQKNWGAEVRALFNYVQNQIRYIKDINGVETLQIPTKTLQYGQGDCDDKATLLASLLESIGHPTRFVAVGYSPAAFSHVYVETKIGNRWIALETTEPWPMGAKPKGLAYRMEHYNK